MAMEALMEELKKIQEKMREFEWRLERLEPPSGDESKNPTPRIVQKRKVILQKSYDGLAKEAMTSEVTAGIPRQVAKTPLEARRYVATKPPLVKSPTSSGFGFVKGRRTRVPIVPQQRANLTNVLPFEEFFAKEKPPRHFGGKCHLSARADKTIKWPRFALQAAANWSEEFGRKRRGVFPALATRDRENRSSVFLLRSSSWMASDRLRMKVGALVDSLGGLKLKWRITFSRPKPYVNRFLLLGTESSSKFAVLRQMFSLCERFPSKFQRCDALWNEQSSSVDHESLHAIRLEILRLAVRVATNISRNNSSASPRFSEITTRLVEAFDEAERLDFASLSSILQDFVQDPEFHSKSTDFEGIPDFLTADRVKRIFDDKTMVKWSDVIESNSSLEGCVFNFKIRARDSRLRCFTYPTWCCLINGS
ncbi:hypothetical protein L596_018688 [Steinernema carpocapsae]|uniref:Uncharacterized protein n=1 Tax=Steinernema carpocapsae TaxID=34508 RepID=A0A4U5N5E1_STECR|nr:hypothetical protein L596_018688 [Steinernema carpocapsae]